MFLIPCLPGITYYYTIVLVLVGWWWNQPDFFVPFLKVVFIISQILAWESSTRWDIELSLYIQGLECIYVYASMWIFYGGGDHNVSECFYECMDIWLVTHPLTVSTFFWNLDVPSLLGKLGVGGVSRCFILILFLNLSIEVIESDYFISNETVLT